MKFEWIVPIIVVVFWIINAIVKSRDNDEPVRAKRPGGGREGRTATGDIDRFLQEIDRLRQKTAEERSTPAPPPLVRPVPVARARPVPTSSPPRVRPVPRPARNRDSEVITEPIVVVPSRPAPPATIASLPLIPSMAARLTPSSTPQQPRVNAALKMLRSPNQIASAIVLSEILGPPKAKRR